MKKIILFILLGMNMYSIGEISKMFDLPISTLRYYDKEGLFPHLKRVNGVRQFSENNTSAKAFKEYVSKEKRILSFDDYGNFEKVGDLGTTLPRNDKTLTTKEGDIILYLGTFSSFLYSLFCPVIS